MPKRRSNLRYNFRVPWTQNSQNHRKGYKLIRIWSKIDGTYVNFTYVYVLKAVKSEHTIIKSLKTDKYYRLPTFLRHFNFSLFYTVIYTYVYYEKLTDDREFCDWAEFDTRLYFIIFAPFYIWSPRTPNKVCILKAAIVFRSDKVASK